MMRSSFAGFNAAKLGMAASNAAFNVIGQNVSNVNTTGYTRQRVDLVSLNTSTGRVQWGSPNQTFIGTGVLVNRIEQVRDPYLDLRFRTEMANVGYYDSTLSKLQELQSVLDEVDKTGSIHNQLEAVFKALNEFNPQAANNEFQNMVKTELQLLTQYFNKYSSSINESKEDNLKVFKEQTIPAVNQLLKDITNLNKSIQENELLGNPSLELRDERNLLLDELSSYVKIEVNYENVNVGLTDKTVEKCTVKLLGIDDDGKNYKYMLIDHDKAAEFAVTDDCSNLTMKDVNGNPVADIGSALKPQGNPPFTTTNAQAMNTILETIQKLSIEVRDQMVAIDRQNKSISSLKAKINSYNARGNRLHDELKDILKAVANNDASLTKVNQDIADALAEGKDTTALEEKKAKLENIQKLYNQKLYGTDTKPADVNNAQPDSIYGKLVEIYGQIEDPSTTPPTYEKDPNDPNKYASGGLRDAQDALAAAQKQLEEEKLKYNNAMHNLDVTINGGVLANGTDLNANGMYLKNYANVNVEYTVIPVIHSTQNPPVDTGYFVRVPVITLAGTSARDGEGIRLFDGEFLDKLGNIAVNGDDITITDTRGVEYTEEVADVDGTPYQTDAAGNIIKDIDGNPILDLEEQRNMYEHMQEDSGTIKGDLDMFNRAGEFTADTDRGYDYYTNMLDTMVRQIAKVFNEANTMDKDGNPLVGVDGKPLDYANALFGANGKVPAKYLTNAAGEYIDYTGATVTEPVYDVFKTDDNGYLLDKDGDWIDATGNKTTKIEDAISLEDGLDLTAAPLVGVVELDPAALAAFGVVKSNQKMYTDANGTDVLPGDWVDADGNKLMSNPPTDAEKQQLFADIKAGNMELLEGKVPKIDYEQITAENFSITKDWAESFTNFVQTHDPSQTAGYNDNINHLISMFSEKLDYMYTTESGDRKKLFNGTFVEFFDNMSNQLGLDIKSSSVLLDNYITVANDIANNKDAVSGVSLDEEGIDMLRFQKAFTASARVMTTLDEALNTIINNMGIVGR